MAFPTKFVRINGVDLPKLKSYKVQRNKLWTDAGRNMNGELRSTFIGIFPKIFLEFVNTTQAEISTLITLLDQASFTVSWWDELTDTMKSGTYYAGDFDYTVINKSKGLYEPFTVNLIPFTKYS
jgi:hypothetical protein